MSKPTIVVYGATSFSGRALLDYLDTHPENEQFDVILAGRNPTKLKASASKLKKKHETITTELTDTEGVRAMVKRANVVINLAGPYRWHHATTIIAECAANGKHYVDLCGESEFVAEQVIQEYHFQASKTGACIIPSCGFDSVPSDMTVYYALRTLQKQYPDASITDMRNFFKAKGSISGGTVQSMHSVAELPDPMASMNEWIMVGRSSIGPSPPLKMVYETQNAALEKPLIGSFFFMYPYNRCVVRRSWALSRSDFKAQGIPFTRGSEPVGGGGFSYDEAMQVPSKIKAFIVSSVILVFGVLFFGSSFTRKLVDYFLPKAGEGASDEELRKGYFKLTGVANTTERDLSVIATCEGEGDPGYISTLYMLAESALSLALPPPKGTELPPLGKAGGVLTPATGLGMVLIERLHASGKVNWTAKVVNTGKRIE